MLRRIGVELDSRCVVVVRMIAAHDRSIAAVGNVDAVLDRRERGLVVLEQQIAREARENAPARVVVTPAIADDHAGRVGVGLALYGDPGARRRGDFEPVDDDVVDVTDPDVVAVGVRRARRVHDDPGLRLEADRRLRRARVARPETDRCRAARRPYRRRAPTSPAFCNVRHGAALRARVGIVSGRGHVVRGARCRCCTASMLRQTSPCGSLSPRTARWRSAAQAVGSRWRYGSACGCVVRVAVADATRRADRRRRECRGRCRGRRPEFRNRSWCATIARADARPPADWSAAADARRRRSVLMP